MSYGKVKEFLHDATDGMISPSTGWLCGLEKEFSEKSADDRERIRQTILDSKIAHTDATSIGYCGKLAHILTLACDNAVAYWGNRTKGYEIVDLSFLDEYMNILVHDAEVTFKKYGSLYQGCLAHELRHLLAVMNNEPDVTWAARIRRLLQAVIEKAKEYKEEGLSHFPDEEIAEIHKRYTELIELAEEEYKRMPAQRKNACDGPAVAARLKKNQCFLLLFLTDLEIPTTNNFAELMLRTSKMHFKQNGGVRSLEALSYFCDALSVLQIARLNGDSRLNNAEEVFSRRR